MSSSNWPRHMHPSQQPAFSDSSSEEPLLAHNKVRSLESQLYWSKAAAQYSVYAVRELLKHYETTSECEVHTIAKLDVPGVNTFAIHGCACDWDSVVRSWSAEELDDEHPNKAAHRMQTQGVHVRSVGCARGSLGDCNAFVCQYEDAQSIVKGVQLQTYLTGPDIECPATCCHVLPCRNTEVIMEGL